jgi:predicted SprT family Zn-dependent metalloprotease
MSESGHRSCKCGAVYRRTESMAKAREINSFQCEVCEEILESWNMAWVPAYRLITGPASRSE